MPGRLETLVCVDVQWSQENRELIAVTILTTVLAVHLGRDGATVLERHEVADGFDQAGRRDGPIELVAIFLPPPRLRGRAARDEAQQVVIERTRARHSRSVGKR